MPFGALDAVVTLVTAWVVIGALGLLRPHHLGLSSRVLFPAGAAVALLLAIVAFIALPAAPTTAVLPLGLPDLPFHVRLDALSAFFLLLIGLAGFAVSLFSVGYFRTSDGALPGLVSFQ